MKVLFAAFMIQIISRYVFNAPTVWAVDQIEWERLGGRTPLCVLGQGTGKPNR